jgi:hypothetical protein
MAAKPVVSGVAIKAAMSDVVLGVPAGEWLKTVLFFFFHILEDEDQFQPFRCEKGTRIQIYVSIPVDGLC